TENWIGAHERQDETVRKAQELGTLEHVSEILIRGRPHCRPNSNIIIEVWSGFLKNPPHLDQSC
ncbi:hypothetical protein, partial [Caballeronia arationis]|uniref:hypothetical protein n=1 Tax=Caballeronia arationis TaxID=1777142 RepID=UPI001F275261